MLDHHDRSSFRHESQPKEAILKSAQAKCTALTPRPPPKLALHGTQPWCR